MSIGNSGRIVIEIEPSIKRQLYSSLARDGMTLKEWFLREVNAYLTSQRYLNLDAEKFDTSGVVSKTTK